MKLNYKSLTAVFILMLTCILGLGKGESFEVKAEEQPQFPPLQTEYPMEGFPENEPNKNTDTTDKTEQNGKDLRAVNYNILDVPIVKQYQNTWCWAACMEMISKYRDIRNYKLQDNIAKTIMPNDLYGGAMEKDMINAVNYVNNYRAQNTKVESGLSMFTLQHMIDYMNPFPLCMVYHQNGAHTILARGYNSMTNNVLIIDPYEGIAHTYSLEQLKKDIKLDGGQAKLSYVVTYDYQ